MKGKSFSFSLVMKHAGSVFRRARDAPPAPGFAFVVAANDISPSQPTFAAVGAPNEIARQPAGSRQ
jgi:hypothetical protein